MDLGRMKRLHIFFKNVFFHVHRPSLALACGISLALSGSPAGVGGRLRADADANARPLSLEQLKKLIGAQVPDAVVAGEIRQRGINFGALLTRRVLEDMATDGAGPKTLNALRAYLPKSSLRVVTKLEKAVVLIDDTQYGQTGLDGTLQISDLEPGEHVVVVRNRPRYGDAKQRVVLRPNESQEVALTLELNVGSLTVTSNVPGAAVTVRAAGGGLPLTGPFANRELPLGGYTVEVKSPDYQTFRQTVEIGSGQSVAVEAKLEVDQASLMQTLESAQRAFAAKDYRAAIRNAQRVAELAPKDAAALSLLAQGHFRLNEGENFLAVARRAIENGAKLDFPVTVRGEKSAGDYAARLRLTAAELIVEPEDAGRQTRVIPLETLATVQIAGDLRENVFLSVGLQRADSKKSNEINFVYAPEAAGAAKSSQRETLNALWNLEDLLERTANAQKELLKLRPDAKIVRLASAPELTGPAERRTKSARSENEPKEKESAEKKTDDAPDPESVDLNVDKLLKRTPTRKQQAALAKVKMKLAALPPDQRAARIFIDQAIRRAGGVIALNKIKGATYEGVQSELPANVERSATFYWAKGAQYREDIKIGAAPRTTVYDDPEGWERIGSLPPAPLTSDALKQRRIQAKLFGPGLYVQLLENEDRAQRMRTARPDGVEIEIIRITDKDGDAYEVHFNAATLLPEKCVYQISAAGGPLAIEEIFSDFMQVRGIRVPTLQTRSVNGAPTLRLRFKTLEFDKPSASLFKKP
jgi:hypothetical protein